MTGWGLKEPEQAQLAELTQLVQEALGPALRGIYLYGSAVLGGLRPRSDLDLMVVTGRPTTPDEKRALIADLLAHSTWPSQAGRLRSVEVTIVVASEVRPWRYPPRMDFQFGGWLRPAFAAGELEPWGSPANPDLAPLLALTRERGVALAGPPPTDLLDPVPHADLVRASVSDLDRLVRDLPDDTRNIVLTLARIWYTVEVGAIVAKDVAADWALGRAAPAHREVLRRARAGYVGTEDDQWHDLAGATTAFAADAAAEIRRLAGSPDWSASEILPAPSATPEAAMPTWNLPFDRPHRIAGRAGGYVFVGGAGDHDPGGAIRHPGDLAAQLAGAVANVAAALDTEGCTLADVVRLKAFYTGDDTDEWAVLAALANAVGGDPPPAITTNPVPMQPWPGQLVQVQAIASRGWRSHPHTRAVLEDVPAAAADRFRLPRVTAGLRAGELLAVPGRTAAAATADVPADPVAQTDLIMGRMGRVLGELGASFQDAIKMEGYYFGSTFEEWAPLAKARARNFLEPGPVATVVPCHLLHPAGTRTKVEVLGLRDHWNGFDKYVPREDRWPRQVWDWAIPLPYRQGIRMRDMIWTGGQVPYEPDANQGRTVFAGELLPQTLFTMRLVEDILRAFGATASDLALLVCYFTSDGSERTTRAFAELLAAAAGGVLPPVTLVPQPSMHDPGTQVEIWGVAQS